MISSRITFQWNDTVMSDLYLLISFESFNWMRYKNNFKLWRLEAFEVSCKQKLEKLNDSLGI